MPLRSPLKGSRETSCDRRKWNEKNWGHKKQLCQYMISEGRKRSVSWEKLFASERPGESVDESVSAFDKNSRKAIHFTKPALSRWKHAVEPQKLVQTNPKKDRFGKNRYEPKLLTEREKWPNRTKLWLWEIRRDLKGNHRKLSENNMGNQNKYEPEDQIRNKLIKKLHGRSELLKPRRPKVKIKCSQSLTGQRHCGRRGTRETRIDGIQNFTSRHYDLHQPNFGKPSRKAKHSDFETRMAAL